MEFQAESTHNRQLSSFAQIDASMSKEDKRKFNRGLDHRRSYMKEEKIFIMMMKDMGKSAEDISQATGVSKSNVEKWCSDKVREKILIKYVQELAKYHSIFANMEDILLPSSFLHFKISSFPSNQYTNPLECEIMWFLGQKIQDNLVSPNSQDMSSAEKLLQHLLHQGLLSKKKKTKESTGENDDDEEDIPNVSLISGEKRPRGTVKSSSISTVLNNLPSNNNINRPINIVSSEGESSEARSISSADWMSSSGVERIQNAAIVKGNNIVYYEDNDDENSLEDSDYEDDEATIQLLLQQQRSKYSSSLLQSTGNVLAMPRISHMSEITMGYNTQIHVTNAVADAYGNTWYATLGASVNMQALRPVLSNTKFLMQVREVLAPQESLSREEMEDRAMMTLLGE